MVELDQLKRTKGNVMKITDITYGYNVLSDNVQPHMTSSIRQVRVIKMKKPSGIKTWMAVIQETLSGEYVAHSVI